MKSQQEHYSLIKDILESKEFQARKNMKHHGTISVYDHSYRVSILAYKIALAFHIDPKDVAIAALLHDFYTDSWQDACDAPFFQHGLTHAQIAADNAKGTYGDKVINSQVYDSIKAHMWPINITKIPKSKEAWMVNIADTLVSVEIFKHPRDFPAYLGLSKRKSTKRRAVK
jgi:uncharacterized protein